MKLNETRFQYYRAASQMIAHSASPELQMYPLSKAA